MRRHLGVGGVLAALVAAVSLVGGGPAGADNRGRPFRLGMSGAEEFNRQGVASNPHGDADHGTVVLTLNQGQEEICWQFGELTLTAGEGLPFAAHIHEAPRGRAGDIVVDLFGPSAAPTAYPTGTTCVPAEADVIKEIRQNPEDYYINLHSAQHPGGMMRAQLG